MRVYYLVFSVLFLAGQAQCLTSNDWLNTLRQLLSIGDAFLDAVQRFENYVATTDGSLLGQIENYCNSTRLYNTDYYQIKGDIDQVHFDITGGERQALTASGSVFGQTEGLVGLHLPNSTWKIVIYWRVPFAWEGKSNKLGIGFVKRNDAGSSWLDKLVTGDSDVSLPMLGVKEFVNDLSAIQCCHEDLCVQGIMDSKEHCNMTVRILPRNADALFRRMPNDQTMLNQLLDRPNTCTSSGATSSVISQSLVSALLLLISKFI